MKQFAILYAFNIIKIFFISSILFIIFKNHNFEKYKLYVEKKILFLLISLISFYIIIFSTLSMLKHYTFHTNCHDLASYVQPLYQTPKGNFLYSSPEGTIYLGIHTAFTLLLFVPFYYLFPSVYFILFLQTIILAIGAVPVYLIAKEKLKSKTHSFVFAFLYLIYPPLHYINLYDFHPDILVTPSFLFAFYFLQKKDYFKMCIFLLIALLTKEQMSLIIFIFGIYIFLFHKKRIFGVFISILSFAFFIISVFYLIPHFSPSGKFHHFSAYTYLSNFFSDPLAILKNILSLPKIGYIILIFFPVCFLSFLSLTILFAAPTFIINLLSNTIQHYSIFFQYTASIIPFLFISAIFGFSKIRIKKFILFILFISIFFQYYFSPSPFSKTFWIEEYKLGKFKTLNFHYSVYFKTPHTDVLKKVVNIIPSDASVSASSSICPHLINREKLYLFPHIPENTEYIIIDTYGSLWPIDKKKTFVIINNLLLNKKFAILFEKDGVMVLKRRQ